MTITSVFLFSFQPPHTLHYTLMQNCPRRHIFALSYPHETMRVLCEFNSYGPGERAPISPSGPLCSFSRALEGSDPRGATTFLCLLKCTSLIQLVLLVSGKKSPQTPPFGKPLNCSFFSLVATTSEQLLPTAWPRHPASCSATLF